MLFKHPELLYALFLLVIPILIHLFQLRRFKNTPFTNVKILKSVKLQTRKSSQLKKWLTLLSRLLLMGALIMAFAQPFIPNTTSFNTSQETVIYLDNSHSMQAKGKNGSLLNEAVQDIINTVPENQKFSLFTNNKTYKNTTVKAIKNELIQLKYTSKQLSYEALTLKGKALFSASEAAASRHLVLISDFQQKTDPLAFEIDSTVALHLVQLKSPLRTNVSIDSISIANTNAETLDLRVNLSMQKDVDNVTVALYNDETLVAKNEVQRNGNLEATFTIANSIVLNGTLAVTDLGLQYDNTFYFNINDKPKIEVLVINENSSDNFLNRVYTPDEFNYKSSILNRLNFNIIPNQNLIVLNELETISTALISALNAFTNNGGHILIIPSDKISLNTYNQLFKNLNIPSLKTQNKIEKRVTRIHYDHPLLADAFYSKVNNFQYPKTRLSYGFAAQLNPVLSYEDDAAFLIGKAGAYAFSSPLKRDLSNFKNSPLIVPVLYNIGKQSLELPKLYYTIGVPNSIAIPAVLEKDDILTLSNPETSIIPLQKTYSKAVVLDIGDYPDTAGIFNVKSANTILQNLSFNFNRDESNFNFYDLSAISNASVDNSLATRINNIKSTTSIKALWKWFAIFAVVFLIIELLLVKYLK